jgi:hypothetical protein
MKALALLVLLGTATIATCFAAGQRRSFEASFTGVHVDVTWNVKTYMAPGNPGPPIPVDSIASARAAFSGPDVAASSASLDRFLFPFTGHNVGWVHSAKDGCGAAARLAFIPDSSSPVPYVAFFTVLGEKGCSPMTLVFVPVRSGDRWAYRAAQTLAVETAARPSPFTNVPFRRVAVFHIARVQRVRLPSAQQFGTTRWFVDLAYGTIGSAAAMYTLDGMSSSARAGEAIEIGQNHRARLVTKA